MKNRSLQFKPTALRCRKTELLLACLAPAQQGALVMRALTLPLFAVFATLTTGASMADNLETKVIKDPQGAALSVVGHYDVGLEKGAGLWSSSRAPAPVVAAAITKFILDDRKRSGLSDDDNLRLVVKSVDRVDNHTVVAQVHQYVGELRVIDSDVTAVFTEDGFLESLNGGIVPNRSPQAQAALKVDRVLEILKSDAKTKAMGDLDGFQEAGENEWRRKDGAAIVVGWSRKYKAPTWKASLPEEIIWIDDKGGPIVRRESHRLFGPTTGCNVRHREWPRSDNGKATSLAEKSSASDGQLSGTMISRITCEANESSGMCHWRLQRQPGGFKHPIDRIQDEDGGEKQWSQGCGSSSTPSFTAQNGDALREQGAFYVANQMRFYINENVWTQVAPHRDANVDIHLDDDTVVDSSGGPSAFFDGFTTSIHAHSSRGWQQVMMHEYGHYVVWTYGDIGSLTGLSLNCEQGVDEGRAIHETLANVFAALYARDSSDIKPQYQAYSGLVAAPAPHTDAESLLMHDVFCTDNQGDPHEKAEAFEQAVWELLFNRDCTVDTCTSGMGVNGGTIWHNASNNAIYRHVGAALGSALRDLGENITHSQVALMMVVKIQKDSGIEAANRAKSVFVHHGVL
ncbi:MAG TPA: hypothetical protein VGW39_10080 [Chthoniobacterales bacterium]|nr:hypothetical protein [Chthoniobacterales bacterium]